MRLSIKIEQIFRTFFQKLCLHIMYKCGKII
nr:MAG TPA: hypothetical protein [Inoviridae sp.]